MAFDTDNSLDLYTRVFDLWKQSTETPTLLKGHQRKLWNVDEWQLNNSLQHLAGETSLLYNHCLVVSFGHFAQEGTHRSNSQFDRVRYN